MGLVYRFLVGEGDVGDFRADGPGYSLNCAR